MTAFHLTIVAGRVRTNKLVSDAELGKGFFKEGGTVGFGMVQPVGEFRTVVGLDALDGIGESFHNMAKKNAGRIGVVFLKRFNKKPSGILIDRCVLKELFSDDPAVFQTGGGTNFTSTWIRWPGYCICS